MKKLSYLGIGPKISGKSEYMEKENFFGDEYRKFSSKTPEFFPLQFKKWFRY